MILRRKLEEVCQICSISSEAVIHFIEEEWLIPFEKDEYMFDEEDIARIKLIIELKEQFGVNEEAIPIILHLIDQLNIYQRNLSCSSN